MSKGRNVSSSQIATQVCLYPIPDGFFSNFQQWLWYRYKDDRRMRLLATTPLIDPLPIHRIGCGRTDCRFNHDSWDHPDYVYATFMPLEFEEYCRTWCQQEYSGAAYERLCASGKARYVRSEGRRYSVFEIADYVEWGVKYEWFGALNNPWSKENATWDTFSREWPTDTSRQQRFIILHRDGFRCQLCGRRAIDGVTLEVDHVLPRAKGGSAVPWNLWTLCVDCNQAKSDRY